MITNPYERIDTQTEISPTKKIEIIGSNALASLRAAYERANSTNSVAQVPEYKDVQFTDGIERKQKTNAEMRLKLEALYTSNNSQN
jgi:hypothetical protein